MFNRNRNRNKYNITPKGECFLNYLKDLKNGKDVYIKNYENSISDVMKITNCRDKAIDILLLLLTIYATD